MEDHFLLCPVIKVSTNNMAIVNIKTSLLSPRTGDVKSCTEVGWANLDVFPLKSCLAKNFAKVTISPGSKHPVLLQALYILEENGSEIGALLDLCSSMFL